jgi:photosystem II stability/assembly factor-like uncharacterized protein
MARIRGWSIAAMVAAVVTGGISYSDDAAAEKAKWTVISDKLLADTPIPPSFNGLAGKTLKTTGVAVDRTTGGIIVVLFRSQIFRSSDRGKTYTRIDAGKLSGICQTGWAIQIDPDDGKRMAFFLIYGTGGMTLDGGKTWTQIPGKFDFGAVDWSAAEPKVMMAVDHGGQLNLSKDAGKTWKLLGPERQSRENGSSIGLGVVNAETLLLHRKDKAGIERSTDCGETWTKVSDLEPRSGVPVIHKGVIYWVGAEGLIVSKDNGATWQLQGSPVDAMMGPYLGKDAQHMVVVGMKGIFETADAGTTWKNVMPLGEVDAALDPNVYYRNQPKFGRKCVLSFNYSFAWDPIGDVFYHSRMTDSVIKYER